MTIEGSQNGVSQKTDLVLRQANSPDLKLKRLSLVAIS